MGLALNIEHLEARRLLISPEIDLTFGEGGVARAGNFWGDALLIDPLPGGKVVLVSKGNPLDGIPAGGSSDPLVARFNADGSPDTTFDGDGLFYLP